jgi:hypothetical protein
MAETTRAATAEFVSANLLARVSLCAAYSDHDDDSLRVSPSPPPFLLTLGEEKSRVPPVLTRLCPTQIFDRADVCFLVSRETRWRCDLAHEDLCDANFDLGAPPPDCE